MRLSGEAPVREKAVKAKTPSGVMAGVLVLPEKNLAAHTVSIREIERLTGLDLLPRLDRAALKEAVASALWPRN